MAMLWVLVLGLIVAVIVVFVRLAELKKEIGWHRRHVHDLASKLLTLESLVSILRQRELAEAAPKPEAAKPPEVARKPEAAEPVLPPAARPPAREVVKPPGPAPKPEVPEPTPPPVAPRPERPVTPVPAPPKPEVAQPPEFAPKPEVVEAAEPTWTLKAPEPGAPAERPKERPPAPERPAAPPQIPPKPVVPPAPTPPPAPAVPPAAARPAARRPEPEAPVLPPKPERPARPEPVAPRAPIRPPEPDRREALEQVARAAAEAPPPEAAEPPKETVVPPPRAAARAPAPPVTRPEPAVTGPPPPPSTPPTPPAERARRRGDIETTIGVRWLSRIGMVAVLIALAFLVKYLYDEEIIRITPPMVIGAGLLLGIGLIAGGELANRRDYEIQSQVLTGGGAAVLYLTLWAGLKLYGIIGESAAFVAMVIVTAVTASQALRHDSETIASFAWVAGYLVPLFIGESSDGGAGGGSSAAPLFVYLALLSVGVFVVAQRRPWPFFTGLALMGAYAGAAYMFRVSDGSLEWTLGYLLLITAGMLWVAASRKGEEGGKFGAIGGIAGYLITGVVMVAGDTGSVHVPYLYLLMLSGGLLFLSRIYGWPALTWCAVAGSVAGFFLLYYTGATQVGNWLLLYVILSVAGAVAASAGGEETAEPLAITAVAGAYGAAAFLVWAPGAKSSITGDALFAYLALLAAGILFVTARLEWPTFSRLSLSAAFLATGLLYQHLPGGALNLHALIYAVLLGAASVAVTAHLEDRLLGGLVSAGVFVSLALTGVLGQAEPAGLVPAYLTVAGLVTVGVIEWRKWYGLEWIPLVGVWLLYGIWRVVTPHYQPDPSDLAFTAGYWVIFLALNWVRHGGRQASADATDALFACTNAALFFAFGMYDLSPLFGELLGPGGFTLALFAVYLAAGLAGLRRSPAETYFAPFLLGIGIVFLTVAMPLLLYGYPVAVAWAAEATILVGLGFFYRSLALRVGGLLVLVLGLFHALAIDSRIDRETYELILNGRALSILAVIAAMYVCSYWYLRHRQRTNEDEWWLGSGLGSGATALLLWIASIETWTYVGWALGANVAAQQCALSGVWLAFGAVFVQLALARGIAYLRWAALALLAATVAKVFLVDPNLAADSYLLLLNSEALPLLGITALLYQIAYWYAVNREVVHPDERWVGPALGVAATALLLWTASAETWREVGWDLREGLAAQHFALSGVWLVFGAAFVQIGIWRRFPYLHWAALSLFAATISKVFLIDPALSPSSYLLLLNSQAVPCLVVAALLYELAYWYACHPEQINDDERWLSSGLGVAATVLLLWTASAETWREVGWEFQKGLVAQHFALSGVWLVFGGVFVQLGIWRRIAYFQWAALALFTATVVKVFVYDPPLTADTYTLLLNSHALPLLVITALLGELAWWHWRRGEEPIYGMVMAVAASLLVFWVCCSETWMYLGWEQQVARAAQQLSLSIVWLVFGMAALAIGMAKRVPSLRWVGLGLFALTGMKVFAIDPPLSKAIYQPLVNHHAFPLIVIAAMLYAFAVWYGRIEDELPEEEQLMDRVLPAIANVVLWWVLSSEAWRFVGWWLEAGRTAQQYALTAVWTAYGAALVTVGLARHQAAYRWAALGLFGVTIIKVGIFDLQALEPIFKILAAMGLGAVLIAASFGYQRLVRAQEGRGGPSADV